MSTSDAWTRLGIMLGATSAAQEITSEAKTPKPAGGTAAGAVDASADGEQLAKGMGEVRSLLQRTATAIAAVATAVLAGLGYTQLHEIFPIPKTASELSQFALLGFVIAAVVGAVWLATRFFRAQRRILLASDLADADDLHGEKALAQRVLDEHAAEEGAASLQALEVRALRFSRMSRALRAAGDESESSALSAEADRLNGVVGIALQRAAATVLEARSRHVFSSPVTLITILLAAVGIIGVFGIADYYKGLRTGFEQQQKCLKAEKEGVLDACAAFQASEQSDAQKLAIHSAAAAETVKEAKAASEAGEATKTQLEVLDRYAACEKEVKTRVTAKKLPSTQQTAAINLCATTP